MITRPNIDAETRVIMNGVPFLHPTDQMEAEKYAKDRIQQFGSGLAMVPAAMQDLLRRLTGDDKLAIAFDFEQTTFALYRFQDDEQYWLPVITLLNKKLEAPSINESYIRNLANLLKQHDLQRESSPAEYLRKKRDVAAKKRAENKTKGDQALLAAIDAMSSRQIHNFIDVHRALHTKEKIVAHGNDLKSIETMAKVSEASPMVPSGQALNEGMHPLIYSRDRR